MKLRNKKEREGEKALEKCRRGFHTKWIKCVPQRGGLALFTPGLIHGTPSMKD